MSLYFLDCRNNDIITGLRNNIFKKEARFIKVVFIHHSKYLQQEMSKIDRKYGIILTKLNKVSRNKNFEIYFLPQEGGNKKNIL